MSRVEREVIISNNDVAFETEFHTFLLLFLLYKLPSAPPNSSGIRECKITKVIVHMLCVGSKGVVRRGKKRRGGEGERTARMKMVMEVGRRRVRSRSKE